MNLGISALEPGVRLPRICAPLSTIPPALRDWYREVLAHRERRPPPDVHSIKPAAAAAPAAPAASDGLAVEARAGAPRPRAARRLVPWVPHRGHGRDRLRRRDRGRTVPARRRRDRLRRPAGDRGLGTARDDSPSTAIRRRCWRTRSWAAAAACSPGAVATCSRSACPRREAGRWPRRACARPRCRKRVHSSVGSSCKVCWERPTPRCSRPTAARQIRLAELDKLRVVDARHDGGVLVVLTSRAGRFDRWVFRFDRARRSYDHHCARDVTPIGAIFVVTDRGTCALRTADGVQVFRRRPRALGHAARRPPRGGGRIPAARGGGLVRDRALGRPPALSAENRLDHGRISPLAPSTTC